MICAKLETPNFTFEGYGKTIEQAVKALKSGLHTHAKQYKLNHDWWELWESDIYTRTIALGCAYRDNEQL